VGAVEAGEEHAAEFRRNGWAEMQRRTRLLEFGAQVLADRARLDALHRVIRGRTGVAQTATE
jgi:hypothetical protein